MSSITPLPAQTPATDDRTTKARIRDAAIECIAEYGTVETTARKVADVAGVSPGLVMHHYGSMDGLRTVCDEHVAATIRTIKEDALSAGPDLDVLAALRTTSLGPLMGYLANVLTGNSPAVAKLVDDLVADAESYIQQGVDAGMLQPTDDPRGRAVILTMWNLGALVLHRHLSRMLGVDLTNPAFGEDATIAAYAGPIYQVYSSGVFSESLAIQAQEAIASLSEADPGATTPHRITNEGAS